METYSGRGVIRGEAASGEGKAGEYPNNGRPWPSPGLGPVWLELCGLDWA